MSKGAIQTLLLVAMAGAVGYVLLTTFKKAIPAAQSPTNNANSGAGGAPGANQWIAPVSGVLTGLFGAIQGLAQGSPKTI